MTIDIDHAHPSSASPLEHHQGQSSGIRSPLASSRTAALVLAALIASSSAQAQDGQARAAETGAAVVAVLVPDHTAEHEKSRAAGEALLAQVAPLFCPGMTGDASAIREYEQRHGFNQKDLLINDQLASFSRDEFRAFQQRFSLSQDVACELVASQLGPTGIRLINIYKQP